MARREREKTGERVGARGTGKDRDPQQHTKIMECTRQPTAQEEKKRRREREEKEKEEAGMG